jgi:hypothetical protein
MCVCVCVYVLGSLLGNFKLHWRRVKGKSEGRE